MHDAVGIIQPGHRAFSLIRDQNRIDKNIKTRSSQSDSHRHKQSHDFSELRIMPVKIKTVTEAKTENTRNLNQELHQATNCYPNSCSEDRIAAPGCIPAKHAQRHSNGKNVKESRSHRGNKKRAFGVVIAHGPGR